MMRSLHTHEEALGVRQDSLLLDSVDERLQHGQLLDGAHVEAVDVVPN